MNNKLFPIELCKYTLRQSLCDPGQYPEFYTAQELIQDLNRQEVNQNG